MGTLKGKAWKTGSGTIVLTIPQGVVQDRDIRVGNVVHWQIVKVERKKKK